MTIDPTAIAMIAAQLSARHAISDEQLCDKAVGLAIEAEAALQRKDHALNGHAAEGVLDNAKREASIIVSKAEERAKSIVAAATAEAKKILDEAAKKAEKPKKGASE